MRQNKVHRPQLKVKFLKFLNFRLALVILEVPVYQKFRLNLSRRLVLAAPEALAAPAVLLQKYPKFHLDLVVLVVLLR